MRQILGAMLTVMLALAAPAAAQETRQETKKVDPVVVTATTVETPAELSVGVLTSFCGAPVFIWLLRSRAGRTAP